MFSRVSFVSVVLRVAAYVQANIIPTGARFNARWRLRARMLDNDELAKAFKSLLSAVPLRAIARLHRTIFRGHRAAVVAVGDMLRGRGLLNVQLLHRLRAEWEEFTGKIK